MNEFLFELIKNPNFLGSFGGALLTGIVALLTYWLDKRNNRKERLIENEMLKKKYRVFYRAKCNQIINIAEYIRFDLNLLSNHNRYNMDPIEEIKENIIELKNIRISLLDSNPDYVPLELYKTVEDISRYLDEMTKNFSGVLATEEEELKQSMGLLEVNSQNLIDLIKENILN